jgi:hypothetical protein
MDLIFYDPSMGPLILWAIFMMYMLFPAKNSLNGRGRWWFSKLILLSLISPFYKLGFKENWVIG